MTISANDAALIDRLSTERDRLRAENEQLQKLLGDGRLHRMLILSARIGQSSGMIDPFSGLDRKELREWHDEVVTALSAGQKGGSADEH